MNYSNYRISLDIHDTASQVSVSVKKGDTKRRICAVLTENGKPYTITEGCYAVFRAKKPADKDGKRAVIFNDCTIEGNIIYYPIVASYTDTVGIADCEITLYGADDGVITSPRFTLVIDWTVTADDEVVSAGQNEVSALTALISRATALKNEIETKLANGEFVGEQGVPGEKGADGKDGYTPIKGVDYFTEADKAELQAGVSPDSLSQFSNAVKGTATGLPIVQIYGFNPIRHKMSVKLESEDVDITDFSDVTVTRCGLNMFKPYTAEATVDGLTAKLTEDGFAETSGTFSGASTKIYLYPPEGFDYVVYPASRYKKYLNDYNEFSSSSIDVQFQFVYLDGTPAGDLSASGTKRFNSPVKVNNIVITVKDEDGANAKVPVVFNFDGLYIEEFVPYVDVTEHKADADGTVHDVYSILPEMILYSNNQNVRINAEYNQDINDALSYLEWMLEEIEDRVNNSINRISYIELFADNWEGTESPYSQVVDLYDVTEYSKVDLNPSVEQLAVFHEKDISFVAENDRGLVTVYCIGQKPAEDYYMQVTLTEVMSIG